MKVHSSYTLFSSRKLQLLFYKYTIILSRQNTDSSSIESLQRIYIIPQTGKKKETRKKLNFNYAESCQTEQKKHAFLFCNSCGSINAHCTPWHKYITLGSYTDKSNVYFFIECARNILGSNNFVVQSVILEYRCSLLLVLALEWLDHGLVDNYKL